MNNTDGYPPLRAQSANENESHADFLSGFPFAGLVDLYDGVDPVAASGIGAFDIMAGTHGNSSS